MKVFNIIHILLFFIMLLAWQCASAQDYVLTTRGDSLTGEVKPLLYGPEHKVLLASDGDKTTYSILEVRAFGKDGDVYHPIRGERGYVFMKLVQPGYLSLYAYQPENQTRFDALWLQKRDGDHLAVPNLGFKKYISQFLEDCPAVADRVREGEFSKRELDKIIAAYNGCVARRTVNHAEIVARREEQASRISPWETLENRIREMQFDGKQTALEMVAEVRKKIRDSEPIPNFLVEGLKNTLADKGLDADLRAALATLD